MTHAQAAVLPLTQPDLLSPDSTRYPTHPPRQSRESSTQTTCNQDHDRQRKPSRTQDPFPRQPKLASSDCRFVVGFAQGPTARPARPRLPARARPSSASLSSAAERSRGTDRRGHTARHVNCSLDKKHSVYFPNYTLRMSFSLMETFSSIVLVVASVSFWIASCASLDWLLVVGR